MKQIAIVGLALLMASCTTRKDDYIAPPQTGGDNKDSIYTAKTYYGKAKVVFDHILKFYPVDGTVLFAENYPALSNDPQVSYMWPLSGLFTGSSLLRHLGYQSEGQDKVDNAIGYYWQASKTSRPLPPGIDFVPGFQSYPGIYGGGDRFYDDNGTGGLDYIEAYNASKNSVYLTRAEECLQMAMTGEDNLAGGGLWWNEQDRTNPESANYIKCANTSAFAAKLALELVKISPNQSYLDFAKRAYSWTKQNLQDPADKSIWNDVNVKSGIPNKTKWSYNTGAMLSNAVLLYELTGEEKYKTDAAELAAAGFKVFTEDVNGVKFFTLHDPWFNVILFRGYLAYYRIEKGQPALNYINTFIANADHAWKSARMPNGFFCEDWSGRTQGRYQWLLHQACMVETYARISQFKGENIPAVKP